MRIGTAQLHELSRAVLEIHRARSYAELNRRLVSLLHRQFHSTISVCEVSSPDGSQYRCDHQVGRVEVPSDYHVYLWDHVMVARLLEDLVSPALHLREFATAREIERTHAYNLIYRPNGMTDQMILVTWHEGRRISYGLNRDRTFTAAEKTLFQLLRPHLQSVLPFIAGAETDYPSGLGGAWLELELDCGRWRRDLKAEERAALRAYFSGSGSRLLPEPVACWTRRCENLLRSNPEQQVLPLFSAESARGRLTLRYVPVDDGRSARVHLMEQPHRPNLYALGRRAGLSLRESEILHWIAQGRRDGEIATIIGVSPRTVSKHVENILRKLRAPHRAGAVAAVTGGGPSRA